MFIKSFNPKIIYEDNHILVINKPAGITVNEGETVKDLETVQNWVEIRLKEEIEKEKESDFAKRAGIVHRLDKETSGILIIAKNQNALTKLQNQFKSRQVKKRYLILVHGIVEPLCGTINAPIARLPWNRKRFGVFPGGREATTDYKVLGNYTKAKEKYSLLEITPHTGRTHQIRVHFKYLGHPVVGDRAYAGRKQARFDRKFCPRQFLHAQSLEIFHPTTGKKLIFKSSLPEDLKKALSFLTKVS